MNNLSNSNPKIRLLLFCAFCFYLLFIIRSGFIIEGDIFFTLVDDAMISMRYAKNLAFHHQLVWNIDEPPVQGFTNLGWTLIMTVTHLIPVESSKISLLIMLLSLVILMLLLLVVIRISNSLLKGELHHAFIAILLTAFCFPLVFWSLRGMETGLIILMLYSLILCTFRFCDNPNNKELIYIFFLICGLIIVRVDSLPYLCVILFWFYLMVKSMKRKISVLILAFLAILLSFGGVLFFQKHYYGEMLPNTYYLKVEGVSIAERIKYAIRFFIENSFREILLPIFILIIGLVVLKRKMYSKKILMLISLFITGCAYSLWTGGDYAENALENVNRFITRGMPALFIVVNLVIALILKQFKWSFNRFAAIGVMIFLLISLKPWAKWVIYNAPMIKSDIERVEAGIFLSQTTPPETVVGAHAVGQIGYYSNRKIIDLLGKNDSYIAKGKPADKFRPGHNKWNYSYSICYLKPDIIADRWNMSGDFMDTLSTYRSLKNGMYVSTATVSGPKNIANINTTNNTLQFSPINK